MGIKDDIIAWLLDSVRIPSAAIVDAVNATDTDDDGYISMREVWERVRQTR